VCLLALLVVSAHAADEDIQQAVDRGVTLLRSLQRNDGTWGYIGREPQEEIGATALAGMTLLECGVPADDPAVEKAAGVVRQASIPLTYTYSISLSILFLDRLGDAQDEQLIQSLAIRLLGGQNDQGGWTYQCPSLDENEQRRLASLKPQQNELVGRRDRPKTGTGEVRPGQELPKEMKDQLARMNNRLALGGDRHPADNSNTQFAALGLWVARRHGIPVERAMVRLAGRFRLSQAPDGSWHYMSATAPGRVGSGTPSMTCAGLLALAVAHGTASQAVLRTDRRTNFSDPAKPVANLGKDFAVRAGLLYLATQIGHANSATVKKRARAVGPMLDYYFLWSLERVGMIFGLKTIGKKDWYAWGSQILLDHQNENGSWQGKYGAGIDTCFALLFLQRANVARDLTSALSGKVLDPGDVRLKAGGVGGEALRARSSKPDEEPRANAERPAPVTEPAGPKSSRQENPAGPPDNKPSDPRAKEPKTASPQTKPSSTPAPSAPALDNAEEREATRLATRLIEAPSGKQEAMIEQLRDRKGLANTEALARAIGQLKGPTKLKARDALAERLARMTAVTLREKLRDDSAEVRRAAALACAMKEDKTFIGDLIALLDDSERSVFSAAHAALKELTRKDFGPAPNASPTDRAGAVAKWKEWWKSQDRAK
jgi:hypothetical protein